MKILNKTIRKYKKYNTNRTMPKSNSKTETKSNSKPETKSNS